MRNIIANEEATTRDRHRKGKYENQTFEG